MDKREKPFNPLFKGAPPKVGKKKRGAEAKAEKPCPRRHSSPPQDGFLDAMTGVKRLPEEPRTRVRTREGLPRPAGPAPHKARSGRTAGVDPPETRVGFEGEKGGRGVPPHRNAPGRNDFLEAMSDVTPLQSGPRERVRTRESLQKPANPAPDDTRQGMNHLHALVKGAIEMDITFSAEYIEGSVRGLDHEIMKKLKKGEFPVQDHIDLHGLTRDEAQAVVKQFLLNSFKLGLRCVLIIHGRGLNSPESFPVLKEGLPIWLARAPVKRIVLAFSTARPYDGGTGAVYVLLRRTAIRKR